MESPSCKEVKQETAVKIYFADKVFGKATKNRREDPNMFELLSWDVAGFEKHSFKKDEKFQQPTEAYLNMIGKHPWKSEAQENFVDYHHHCIDANPDVLHKIETYIEERLPSSAKPQRKSPSKPKGKDKKLTLPKDEDKKDTKHQPANYLSPKAPSSKHIPQEALSPKLFHRSSADLSKSIKKMKNKEELEGKVDGQPKQNNQSNPKQSQKNYGQSLEREKLNDQEMSEHQQQKLIEHFKQTTRWIPNSSFTTYFGKPPFENYGRGNTKPIDGGLVYGTYLYSHNVHPHRGKNQPKNIQSYPVALMKAKSQGMLHPSHPRTKPTHTENPRLNQTDHRSKIEPQGNYFAGTLDIQVPKLSQMEKFGGKGRSSMSTDIASH